MSIKTRVLNIFRLIFKIRFLEKTLRKLTTNKSPNKIICKFVPLNKQYPKGSQRFISKNKLYFEVDLSDYIGHYFYFGFKDASHEKLFSLIKKSDVILDIGANIGLTIIQMASKTNEKIFGFEPHKKNYKACLKNLSLNSFKNISVINKGLGQKSGSYYMESFDYNSGKNRISNSKINDSSKIEITTIDSWTKENNIDKIDLIKIDVEGYETQVLKGGGKIIRENYPKFFIEVDDNLLKKQNSSAKELIEILYQYNYSIKNAVTREVIKPDFNFENCHLDIIATR